MRCKGIVFNCNEDVKRLMLPEGTNKSKKDKITQFELCAERKRSRSEESDHHLKKLENTQTLKRNKTLKKAADSHTKNKFSPISIIDVDQPVVKEGKSTTGEAPIVSSITSDEQIKQ